LASEGWIRSETKKIDACDFDVAVADVGEVHPTSGGVLYHRDTTVWHQDVDDCRDSVKLTRQAAHGSTFLIVSIPDYPLMYRIDISVVGGVAQWLGRWSVAGGLSLIYAFVPDCHLLATLSVNGDLLSFSMVDT